MMDISLDQSRPLAPGICRVGLSPRRSMSRSSSAGTRGIPTPFTSKPVCGVPKRFCIWRDLLEALVAPHDPLAFCKALLSDSFVSGPRTSRSARRCLPGVRAALSEMVDLRPAPRMGSIFRSLARKRRLLVDTVRTTWRRDRRANWSTIFSALQHAGISSASTCAVSGGAAPADWQATQHDSNSSPSRRSRPRSAS